MSNKTNGDTRIREFLVSRGGPFYALQEQLGLLRDDAFRAGSRAALLVGLAWVVPLILSIIAGNAYGPSSEAPYLLDLGVWSRFFIAVGFFMLLEQRVEERLGKHLSQFVSAPLLAPDSFEPAAVAVTNALKRRDAFLAEAICLAIAIFISFAIYSKWVGIEASSWSVNVLPEGGSLTIAGWWCLVVSNPLFIFLLLRWFWRIMVWSFLLRHLASLELRLVATHPDGRGGLAFIGQFPNAYTMYIFTVSCVLGAAVAQQFLNGDFKPEAYGYLMAAWLVIVLALFAWPLHAFSKPLTRLKEQTLLACSVQATRRHRATEREVLGKNISAVEDVDATSADDIPDPTKMFETAKKLSTSVFSRQALLPVSAAALLPLLAAGATQLPIMELFKFVKRILLF